LEESINIKELPKDWNWVKLGEVCFTTSGGTPSRREPQFYNGNIPWVKSGELDKGLITDTEEKISEDAIKNSSAKVFPKGTLLIALYGATIGKLAFLGVDAATNQAICGIYKSEQIDSHYLYNFLLYKKQKLVNQGIGGAQPNISQTILKGLDIPLPPKPTQLAIVSKIEELFSEIEKGIESLFTAQQQLKTYRQSVLKWAFEGKLTEQRREKTRVRIPAAPLEGNMAAEPEAEYAVQINHNNQKNHSSDKRELPEGWEMKTIGDIFEVFVGSTPKRNRPEYWGGNINWVSSGEIAFCNITKTKEKITVEGLENTSCKVHPIGTVIIAMIGEGKTRGQAAILKIEASHNQNTAAIRVDSKIYKSELLYYYLVLKYEDNRRVGSGNNQKALNKERVKNISIPVPPIKEQQQILQEIESRLSVADKMEESISQSLQQAEALKQSILKKAFEGRLV
jgi:type I restriction enzyme S subunit